MAFVSLKRVVLKNGKFQATFFYFSLFHITQIKYTKSVDGVLGTQTWGGRMEGTDESTELRLHPYRGLLPQWPSMGHQKLLQIPMGHLMNVQLLSLILSNFSKFSDGIGYFCSPNDLQVLAVPTVQQAPGEFAIPDQLEACGDQAAMGSHLPAWRWIRSQ